MTVEFHPEARLELKESAAYYETCVVGLGVSFVNEIEAAIGRVLQTPERWRLIEQDVRRCLARRFPYGILYTIEPRIHPGSCGYALQPKAGLLA